jgi:hypothetical protein
MPPPQQFNKHLQMTLQHVFIIQQMAVLTDPDSILNLLYSCSWCFPCDVDVALGCMVLSTCACFAAHVSRCSASFVCTSLSVLLPCCAADCPISVQDEAQLKLYYQVKLKAICEQLNMPSKVLVSWRLWAALRLLISSSATACHVVALQQRPAVDVVAARPRALRP